MRRALLLAVLYTAIAFGANPAFGAGVDIDAMKALRTGEMKKLAIAAAPVDLPAVEVTDLAGGSHVLAERQGKYVLVNFWATWCAPCRKEMPGLEALQQELGGADFEVLLIAVGRNPPPAIAKFFDEAGIDALETWLDPKQKLASQMGVFGLPITILLNPEGQEIARMRGDADWNSDAALAFLRAVIAGAEG
ncbi:MAG: TlpA disulfide reductase family protein [Rhodobacterales bacterium]